jgi:LmbE family N-acetylglucosaminyl deacetylase
MDVSKNIDFSKAVIVACHPDDEAIWFTSALAECKKVIICFSSLHKNDANGSTDFSFVPETNVPIDRLNIQQSRSFLQYPWKSPIHTEYGVRLKKPNLTYEHNYLALRNILKEKLQGEAVIITHNPWGEYGHEEHIQVFKAVASLAKELNFILLVDSYIQDFAFQLASAYQGSLEPASGLLKTNKIIANKLKQHYISGECWTWSNDYQWPQYEYFLQVQHDGTVTSSTKDCSVPLNVLYGHLSHLFLIARFIQKIFPVWFSSLVKKVALLFVFRLND